VFTNTSVKIRIDHKYTGKDKNWIELEAYYITRTKVNMLKTNILHDCSKEFCYYLHGTWFRCSKR